jgi:hypothetical protein
MMFSLENWGIKTTQNINKNTNKIKSNFKYGKRIVQAKWCAKPYNECNTHLLKMCTVYPCEHVIKRWSYSPLRPCWPVWGGGSWALCVLGRCLGDLRRGRLWWYVPLAGWGDYPWIPRQSISEGCVLQLSW